MSLISNDPPSAPRNFRATRGDDQVTLNWNAPSSWGDGTAERYQIQWRASYSPFSAWSPVHRAGSKYEPEASVSRFVFSGGQEDEGVGTTVVTNRNSYAFRISAVSAQPKTASDWVEVSVDATAPPPPPTNFRVTPGNENMLLQWFEPKHIVEAINLSAETEVTGYDLHYTSVLDRGLVPDTWKALDNPPGFQYPSAGWVPLRVPFISGTQQKTISDLTPGTTYRFRVRSRNSAGGGDWAFVTGTTSGTAPPPVREFAPAPGSQILLSATLRVDASGTFRGCDDGEATIANCSAALTTNSFTYKGTANTIQQLTLNNFGGGFAALDLGFTTGIADAAWRRLTLHLDGNPFPVADADTITATSAQISLVSAPNWTKNRWVQVHLTYNPPTVSLSASPSPVQEGSPVTVTATLSEALGEVSIPLYSAMAGTFDIDIPAGQTTGTHQLTAPQLEDGEMKQYQIAVDWHRMPKPRPLDAKGSQSTARVQVLDENADPHRVSVSDASGTEMENGYPRMCFAFTLDRAASHEIWVNYWTEDGTATAGLDYRGITHPLAIGFDPGETRKEKCISILDDNVEDSGETFYVVLGNPPHGAVLGRDRGTGTIYNHEPTSLSALTAEGASGEEGPFTALDIGSFAPATTAYAATVPHGTTHARLTPKSLNPHLTITTGLDGKGKSQVSSGGTGPAVALAVGENVLVVKTLFNGQRQTYTVTVTREAKPAVASAIADISSLEVGASQEISLSGVFSDADGDALTLSAASSNDAVATAAVAADYSTLTLAGKAAGTATITVTAQDPAGNQVSDAFDVTVVKANSAPTVASAISDATIANESGTHQVSLSGVFGDADQDSLTITAMSSATAIATVSVASDQTSLTVSAKKRGTCRFSSCPWMQGPATITVTANDGNGGSVDDSFTVTVKAAPTVASAIADVSELEVDATHKVSLSGVFNDADGDSLTVTANSSNDAVATVAVAADYSGLTLTGKGGGTATITVTAQDSDGNTVSDAFDVTVIKVNNAPTVSSAIADATIVNRSGTSQVSLSGVFSDADSDNLTITAESSSTSVATATVSADYSTLTVSAQSRGTANITVTAADGNGESVEDTFTVTVKAAPVVASAIADVSELEIDATHEVSMSGVFSDADGDALTISATTSDSTVVQVANTIDPSTGSATAITVIGVAAGTATITVTARDSDGNSISDAFNVTVPAAQQQGVELPGPVTGLTVTASAENSVTVSWSAPETGGAPDGYIVHLRPEGGQQGSGTTKRPKAKKTQVKFNNLQPGQTYQVWARAQNEAGKGERVHASITLPESGDGQTGQ